MAAIIRRWTIPPGNAGILLGTIERMRALIAHAQGSPWLRWAVSQIPPGPPAHRAAMAYEWVLRRLVYVPDGQASDSVPEEEEIRSPDYLLSRIVNEGVAEGDCDDFVILIGALLVALHVPARIVVTSARADREFDHVFLEVFLTGQWVTFDGIHGAPIGWSVPASGVTYRREVPL